MYVCIYNADGATLFAPHSVATASLVGVRVCRKGSGHGAKGYLRFFWACNLGKPCYKTPFSNLQKEFRQGDSSGREFAGVSKSEDRVQAGTGPHKSYDYRYIERERKMYIYIYRERERRCIYVSIYIYIYIILYIILYIIHIYIYIYIYPVAPE